MARTSGVVRQSSAFSSFEINGPASQPGLEAENGQGLSELIQTHASLVDDNY